MRPPLEFGDNFPVAPAQWNSAQPWRFPNHEILPERKGFLGLALPWITLGLGVSLGILWMSWRMGPVEVKPEAGFSVTAPRQQEGIRSVPSNFKPVRARSRSHLA